MSSLPLITPDQAQIEYNRAKYNNWLPFFKASAAKHNFTVDLLLGISSRETHIEDIKGDYHGGIYHGYSLMQIDIGTDPTFCAHWKADIAVDISIERGVQILAGKCDYLARYNITDIKAIASAYNTGEGNVRKNMNLGFDSDYTTTGHNYGADVVARAYLFKELLDKETTNG